VIQLPPMPDRIAALPRDERGIPVPFFVAWIDGKPLFPVIDPAKQSRAIRERLCWVCGEPLARNVAFVIGPMCAINRVSAEPPSHLECAVFSATACPFLTRPGMKRMDLTDKVKTDEPPGLMIRRNPGVCLVWSTREYRMIRAPNGVLFRVGEPTAVRWFAEGRQATRAEVLASIESGLPILREAAERDGPPALAMLAGMTGRAMSLVPTERAVNA
jgi:hypothetical protein